MLNKNYYTALIDKFPVQQDCNEIVYLSASMILKNYKNRNIHFNFPKNYDLKEIINLLYEDLSKQIFANHADITDYSINDRLQRKKEKGKNIYVIEKRKGNLYILKKEKDNSNTRMEIKFDSLKKNYIKISKSTSNRRLSEYENFFKKSNNYEFLPTHFSRKLIFIAGQTIWNNLKNKSCIPTTYLPNTRDGEQTKHKSIEALEDSIVYITPKYEICYDEILKKNIKVDTVIVCDTDLDSIPQILQDKTNYDFNLIIFSTENEIQRNNNLTLWNWKKEEIGLMEQKGKKIHIDGVKDIDLNNKILHFEKCIKHVFSLETPIKLKSYGYFFLLSLSALQEEQFDYLLIRLKNNKELEHNDGCYEDFGDNNPKESLKNLIYHLKENNPKLNKVNKIISNTTKKTLFVVDRENLEFFKTNENKNCQFITQKELKKIIKNDKTDTVPIVFYTFNGSKDFDFIYNLSNNVILILYKQEKKLYDKQLQIHINQLEAELTSEDRYKICNVKYEQIVKEKIKVSPTLEQIIERIEQRSNIAYDGYKDESDSLLDDLEENIIYRITFSNNETIQLESNETVFNEKGDLVKPYRLKIGNKIHIYPKEKLAENLFQIAVEVEPEKFGKIYKDAIVWQKSLLYLKKEHGEQLYNKLKENGLKVLPTTVDAYFRCQRKFPMYNTDLRAILKLAKKELLYDQIKKSKSLYNSTMIALGRGIKRELQQFFKNNTVGEILQKKNFTKETLQKFIDEFMPLLMITKIEEISNEQ
ncbi:MAG: hypothetical protein LBM25_06645 [Bacteroidales bacterium]|jgi:hypothetical protein|nr:hypothetical protein [Bacteroidales bacterium]